MKNRNFYWWYWIIGIDLFLIINTMIGPYIPTILARGIIIVPFNLGVENNFAAWWSTNVLLISGFLAFERFSVGDRLQKYAWLIFSMLLFGLALDEIGSMHERVGNWAGLFPFGLLILATLVYTCTKFFQHPESKKTSVLIIIGFLLFGSVAVQEYLQHNLQWPYWLRGIRTGIEEGTELMGSFIILYAIVLQKLATSKPTLQIIIPKITVYKKLPYIISAGTIVFILICLFHSYILDYSIDTRGNPLTLYPIIVYFILFSGSFWVAKNSTGIERNKWIWLSIIFFLLSSGSVFNLLNYVIKLRNILPNEWKPFLMHGLILIVLLPLCWRIPGIQLKKYLIPLLVITATFSLKFVYTHFIWPSLVTGLFAYVLSLAFMKRFQTSNQIE